MNNRSISSNGSPAISCSIVIPTRDQLSFLRPCIDSLLLTLEDAAVEIVIVDNHSEESATLEYLDQLAHNPLIRILRWDSPFNFSAINNYAVANCHGEVICFLNNDIEVIDPAWLKTLLPLARRDDCGAVGCLLLYPDLSIQHAGIALDRQAVAKHIAAHEPADFFERHGIREPFPVDAATAACLLMRRALFQQLGGFDAVNLPVAFNDVDLCLRIRDQGLQVLLHPEVKLIHHESVSRKSDSLPANRARAEKEHAYMCLRWQSKLAGRHYDSGLPDIGNTARKKTSPTSQRSQDETPGRSVASAMTPVNAPATADSAIDWQGRYESLRIEYENLRAHAARLELAHRLIEDSIFWRMTAPLRRLRAFFSRGRQNPPVPNPVPPASPLQIESPTPSAEERKAEYDRRARDNLKGFLLSTEKLVFPRVAQPRLSIILVFYNQAHLSLLCLQSLLQFADVDYELIIVDNNSRDETSRLLAQLENTLVILNPDNRGFVEAVNQGAAAATGEYLLILNNDALLEAGTLSSALAVFEEEDDVGAVGAMIKMLDGKLQEAGSIIWNDGACFGYGRGQDPKAPEFRFRRDVDYCSGAFLLFRRTTFEAFGGFDEIYAPAYYEESDFCIRLHDAGLRVIYNPETQITHYEFASSGGLEGASKLQAEHRKILCAKHAEYLRNKYANSPGNILAARTHNAYKNVLIIDDRVPHPSLGAGYPRAAHLINELAALPLNVSFYPLLYPADSWRKVYESLDIKVEVMLGRGAEGLQSFLVERKGYYDTIVVSRCHNMEFFNSVACQIPDALDGVRIIYDAEAVTAPREHLKAAVLGAPISDSERATSLRSELELARSANLILAVSDHEAAIFRQHDFNNTLVLGHTMDIAPTPRDFHTRRDILFVGALRDDGSPNVDSLLWFCDSVLPLIERVIPDIVLHVVGDGTAPSLASISHDNIRLHGRLHSIEELYDTCRIFVAPTRFAAGIPHKVHEAAAHGLPSVTTSLLAHQLSWRDEQQLLAADSADNFAEQCLRLLHDEQLWLQIREAGLQAITRDCSTTKFREQLAVLFGNR